MVTDLENRGQVAPKDEGSSTVSAGLTIDKQSQDGYLSYKTESPHSVLTNCYLGTGGCKMTVQNGNRSYVVCNSRELQYVDRVEFSERVNFYRKGVDSRVGPIFVDSEIENKIFKNSEELPLDSSTVKEFNAWMKGYDTYLQQATTQCISNDVVYILMDKLPSTGEIKRNYRRAIDVLFEPQPNEETGELEWIMFYDTKVIDPETRGTNTPQYILKGTQHYMEGGRYYKQRMEAPYTGNCKTSEEPWEKDGEPIDTGSNRMLVTPIVIGGHAEGTLLPEHPSGYEVARLDLLVMNILSKILWIQNVHGHPILSIAGKIDGVNLNIGSIINRPTDGMGNTSPSPEFVERDPDALRASLELLYWAVSQVNAAQKQFGVTAQSNTDAAQTAESKSYDYQATNQALRSTIKHVCRPIDNTVLSNYMYLKSSSDDEWENQRTYPDDFFPDTAETIDELIALEELAVNRGLIDVAEETWLVIIEMLAPNLSIARKQELKDSLGVLEKFTTDDGQEVVVRKLPDDDLEEDE